ncbi:MAG: tryptophan synthase subunit alpha [Pyrinomonadaceae bacterium]|nr:tryptophan synthase subunit alpha [Pyrinomonadaceae bacterium]
MSRIENALQKQRAFVPFVTAGDPDARTSLAVLLKLAELGADVIELGVPFSDPMADGPVIQRSSDRAISGGMTLAGVLGLAAEFRRQCDVPLVLFSYFNPILNYGLDRFAADASASGIDGVLLTDVIDAEAAAAARIFGGSGIDLISLIAPTTSDERLELICRNARGFVYAVSRAGVTGARIDVSSAAEALVARARRFTRLPIAVGFGISTREQVEEVWRFADAAVVGSAIVSVIEGSLTSADTVVAVDGFVRSLLPQFAKTGAEN